MNINPDGSYSSGPFNPNSGSGNGPGKTPGGPNKAPKSPFKRPNVKLNLPGKSVILVLVLVVLVLVYLGLKFKIPFIQDVTKVSKTIQGFPLGYRIGSSQNVEEESLMITYDYNFVNVDFYVEYRVTDPIKYLYSSQNPVDILKMLCQSYIRDTIGLYNVDTVITTGKSEIQAAIKDKVMQRLEQEDIGLQLANIRIQDAEPPTSEVQRAFTAVETAKQSADTTVNNAKKYANEVIPAAAADADQIIKSAEAYKESKINEANGQASRFAELFSEYQKYPLITKQRLFYEAMETILPGMKLYVLDADTGVQTALPLEQFATVNMGGEDK